MIRKQVSIFAGVDIDEIQRDINEWINKEKIDVIDIKVNAWSPRGDERIQEYYVFTVIYSVDFMT